MNQLKNILRKISDAVKDRKNDFHTFYFSNINDGDVESRCVILRNFNINNNALYFHTDKRSPKVVSIKKNPTSFCLFYSKNMKTQLRIKTFSYVHLSGEILENAWLNTKLSSRKCYMSSYSPSQFIHECDDGIPFHLKGKTPTIKESQEGKKNFAVVENKIVWIDWLFLDSKGHKRKKFFLNGDQKKEIWLAP